MDKPRAHPPSFLTRLVNRAQWEWQKRSLNQKAKSSSLPIKAITEPVTLFFSPEADVTPHFGASGIIAKSLQEAGEPVLFVRCRNLYSRCPVFSMHAVSLSPTIFEREQTCNRCIQKSIDALQQYELNAIDMNQFYTKAVRETIQSVFENPPEDLRDLDFDNIGLGSLSTVDLVLSRKIMHFERVTGDSRQAWLMFARDTLTSYLITLEILKAIPVKNLVYHNDYALMLGARMAAEKNSIPVYCQFHPGHLGGDRQHLAIIKDLFAVESRRTREDWQQWRELSLSKKTVASIGTDLMLRFQATRAHHYSPAKSFGSTSEAPNVPISPNKKTLVAFTSSQDEFVAVKFAARGAGRSIKFPEQPFKDQIDWLKQRL